MLDAVVTLNQVDSVRGEELLSATATARLATHGAESVAAAHAAGFGVRGTLLTGDSEEEGTEGGEVGGNKDGVGLDTGSRGVIFWYEGWDWGGVGDSEERQGTYDDHIRRSLKASGDLVSY